MPYLKSNMAEAFKNPKSKSKSKSDDKLVLEMLRKVGDDYMTNVDFRDTYADRYRMAEHSRGLDGEVSAEELEKLLDYAKKLGMKRGDMRRYFGLGRPRIVGHPGRSEYGSLNALRDEQRLAVARKIGRDSDSNDETVKEKPGEVSTTTVRPISRKVMVVDPDRESSSLCTACRIPIFSTPSVSFSHNGEELFLHDQCAMLPKKVFHELHRDVLVLRDRLHDPPTAVTTNSNVNCSNCKGVCGTMFYECSVPGCDFRLDLICVVQIKVMHRIHPHSMAVIRQRDSDSLTCSACEKKHVSSASSELSYLCNICADWIHPECASLPNAIVDYENHRHSLLLTYNLSSGTGSKCVICTNMLKKTHGAYICLNCDDYGVHTRCALTNPETFKSVFIKDAKVSDLARLPMPDESMSLIPYIRSASGDDDHLPQEKLHEHPLTLHGTDDGDEPIISSSRACNACVQSISPPFFGCSECPSFFLHSSCAHLPSKVQHRAHKLPLYLSSKASKSDISGSFYCKGCELRCNGFAYSDESGEDDYNMDVVCALLNPAITHGLHKKTHFLFMSRDVDFGSGQICSCCSSKLRGICYECNVCPEFKLHARCALLPSTVSHAFDKHPLKLTTIKPKERSDTTTDDVDDEEICEVCEEHLDEKKWYYSCRECDQSFHVDCIPSVDQLSKINLGSTISVKRHGCPLTLVREGDAVCIGRRCGACGEVLKSSDDGLAYECSKCFFGIHYKCAEK